MKKRPAPQRSGLSKLLLVILFVVLMAAGWLCQAGIGMERTLFNAAYYHAVLNELQLGTRLRDFFLQRLAGGHPELPAADSVINRALAEAVDPAWLAEQADQVVADTVAYMKGEQPRLLVVVDLRERKDVFRRALKAELKKLSPPALEQLALPGTLVDEFIDQLDFPDRLVLLDVVETGDAASEAGKALSEIRKARVYFRYAPYLLLGTAALLCFWWAGLAGALKWLGCSMLASGLSYLAALAGARVMLPLRFAGFLADHELFNLIFTEGPAAVLTVVAGSAYSMLAGISLVYAAAGLPLLCAGVILARPALRQKAAKR